MADLFAKNGEDEMKSTIESLWFVTHIVFAVPRKLYVYVTPDATARNI